MLSFLIIFYLLIPLFFSSSLKAYKKKKTSLPKKPLPPIEQLIIPNSIYKSPAIPYPPKSPPLPPPYELLVKETEEKEAKEAKEKTKKRKKESKSPSTSPPKEDNPEISNFHQHSEEQSQPMDFF